jgi:hypothetical protein
VTNFSNTGLSCGAKYFYRVNAYRPSDAPPSTYSNKANNTTLSCVKVYLPTMLRN